MIRASMAVGHSGNDAVRAEVLRIRALVTNRPPIGPTRNTEATTVHINLSKTQVCDSGECSVFLRSYYELTRQYQRFVSKTLILGSRIHTRTRVIWVWV